VGGAIVAEDGITDGAGTGAGDAGGASGAAEPGGAGVPGGAERDTGGAEDPGGPGRAGDSGGTGGAGREEPTALDDLLSAREYEGPRDGLPDPGNPSGDTSKDASGGAPGPDQPVPGSAAGPAAGPDRRSRRRRRTRRVLYGALVLLCVGVLLVVGGGYWAVEHYTGRVQRIPNAFPTNVPKADQPLPSKDGSQTFLLVGLDARSDLPTTGKNAKAAEWKPGAQRSDTMMLVHIPANHKNAYVVSLPRDSWVSVPGHGKAKLNAAFSWGGPPLLIDTVQRMTKLKIDHLMVIDWSGFKRLTDAVGGVDITVDKTVSRRNGPGGVWTAGTHHMNGAEALDYVRERYSLPRGDLDRTHRQQNFLRAVLGKMLSSGTFSNPLKLKRALDQVTSVVSVDDKLSDGDLRGLVWDMRGVRSKDMVFMNAPVAGFDTIQKQSVVLLDANATSELWEAMRNDTMAHYVATNTLDKLGSKVS
jgi:LCP family protein required for cell wall assembly